MEWKDVAGCASPFGQRQHTKKNKHFLCFSNEKTKTTIIKDLIYLSSQTHLSSQEKECLSSAQTRQNEELFDKVRRGAWSWFDDANFLQRSQPSEKDQDSLLRQAKNEATEKFYIGYLVSLKNSNSSSTTLPTQFLLRQFEHSGGEKTGFAHNTDSKNSNNESQMEAGRPVELDGANFSKEPWTFLSEGSEAEKPAKEKGTLREQIKNIMTGITQGFTVNLELKGIGYQAKLGKVNEFYEFPTRNPQLGKLGVAQQGPTSSLNNYWKHETGFFSLARPSESKTPSLEERHKETQITEEQLHSQSRTIDKRKHIPHTGQLEFDIQRVSRLQQLERSKQRGKTRSEEENNNRLESYRSDVSKERAGLSFGPLAVQTAERANLDQHLKNQGSISAADGKERKTLILNTGHSHELVWPLYTKDVCINVSSPKGPATAVTLSIFGISRSVVNQVAAEIYSLKKPEPYKGKGIRYDGEKLFLKKGRAKK